ncbi:MAG: 50S ribosomal protein L3 [Clostridiales bacterium]|nr:50S ribosomal protein L3 [Clostridiales bacterium]
MARGILGKKLGMTQMFDQEGRAVPVTLIEAGPCTVIQVKTVERDGYEAVQLGWGTTKEKRLNRPLRGHLKKYGVGPVRVIREFRWTGTLPESGTQVTVEMFRPGQKVHVTGISKGKGFAGAIKRHNQRRGPMSHGSKYHRGVGSMGGRTFPGRVFKGKKMPGHMGHERVTVRNLEVVHVDADRHLLAVKGAVPGPRGSTLMIQEAEGGSR